MDDKAWQLLMKKIDIIESDVKDVKKEMGTLKLKVAGVASMMGAIAVMLKEYFS